MLKSIQSAAFTFLTLAAASIAQTPIKVLFWGGGITAHNPTAMRDSLATFFASNNIQISYRADSTNAPVWLHPDSLAQYDVMLMYTTNQNATILTATQLNNLKAWVESGRVIVAVHGSTNTYINNNATITAAWRALLGAQYVGHGPVNTAGTISTTTAGTGHSSLTGTTMLPTASANTGGAPYWDEGREHTNFVSDTVVLARSVTSSSNFPWIWVRPQGNGWIYYNASGHDGQVWRRAEYKGQLLRALNWGYQMKVTGIRGQAALNQLLRFQGNDLVVPFKAPYKLQISDMQGRSVFFRGKSSAAVQDLGFLPAGSYGVDIVSETQEVYRGLYLKPR
jgi:type 1 glutamine amidotransferase